MLSCIYLSNERSHLKKISVVLCSIIRLGPSLFEKTNIGVDDIISLVMTKTFSRGPNYLIYRELEEITNKIPN